MSLTVRSILAKFTVVSALGAITAACASDPLATPERDSSAPWAKHGTIVDGRTITFELPPGGNFNPEPNQAPLKFGTGALGAVSYGRRPQGRELVALRVSVEIRRYPAGVTFIPEGRGLVPGFSNWIDGWARSLELVETRAELSHGRSWYYQKLFDPDSKLNWGENYVHPFDQSRFIMVSSLLSPSYAKVDDNVARSHEILGRIFRSFTLE